MSTDPVVSPQSAVAALRAATHALHARLDGSMRLHESLATRDGYVAFLRASYAAVEPIERGLAVFPQFPSCERALRIRDDLAALEADTGAMETAPDAPAIDSEARAFGCAYVLEGSTMGGLVLAKRVDETLALDGRAVRYLRLRGTQTMPAWQAFLSKIKAWGLGASTREIEAACDAAVAAFHTYLSAFVRAGIAAPESQ